MKKIRQWILSILILLLIGSAIYSRIHSSRNDSTSTSNDSTLEEYPEIGFLAPVFSLKGLDNQTYELNQYRGKPVILNFWASWCSPCIEEAPHLVRLHSKYGKDIQIMTVNLSSMDNLQSTKAFVKQHGFTFPVLLDSEGSAATSYKFKPIPATFFIDQNGLIVDGVYGGLSWSELECKAKQLLQTEQSPT